MSIRDVIESFRQFIEDSSGKAKSTSLIPNRYLYNLLVRQKNLLVTKEYKQNPASIGDDLVFHLNCVPFEEIDVVEAPIAPPKGCYFMKSLESFPEILTDLPITVVDVDGGEEYDFVKWNYFKYKVNSRIKAQSRGNYYTMKKNGDLFDLYLFNANGRKAVSVDIIPSDALDFHYFKGCGEEKLFCNPLEKDAYIPTDRQVEIFGMALQEIQNSKSVSRGSDILNNANDDTEARLGGNQKQ